MEKLLHNVSLHNDLIIQGKILEAFDHFYDESVEIRVNDLPPVKGKKSIRKSKVSFHKLVKEWRKANPLKVAVGEGTTMVEWHYDFVHEHLGEKNFNQISVYEWIGDKIVRQTTYHGEKTCETLGL